MYEFHVTFNFCDHGVSQLFLMMFTIVHMNLMLLWFALRMFEDIHHWCLPIAFHHDVHHSLNSMFIWIFSNVEVLFQLWKKFITRSSLLMFPNWFTPWSWPPLNICMYEFHSASTFINDYSVSKLLFTMIFSIVRIPF